ncbi:MAG: hypothetical protein IPP72_20480 [Chitinophagaceae bacterium]|nr:hypothetical protein [Chitinophagaceae bacterium]
MSNDAKISDVLHSVCVRFFKVAKVVDFGGFLALLNIENCAGNHQEKIDFWGPWTAVFQLASVAAIPYKSGTWPCTYLHRAFHFYPPAFEQLIFIQPC